MTTRKMTRAGVFPSTFYPRSAVVRRSAHDLLNIPSPNRTGCTGATTRINCLTEVSFTFNAKIKVLILPTIGDSKQTHTHTRVWTCECPRTDRQCLRTFPGSLGAGGAFPESVVKRRQTAAWCCLSLVWFMLWPRHIVIGQFISHAAFRQGSGPPVIHHHQVGSCNLTLGP